MKIETKSGETGELSADTMPEMVEAGRKFCLSTREGWPTDVVVWEHVENKPEAKVRKKL